MATTEATTAVVHREMDLQEFVQNSTWRELLIELVTSNQLDPWDVDISKVVDEYLSAIRKMKVLELKVPANIVLAASILLRMKSDTLSIFAPTQEETPADPMEMRSERPNVEALVPRARMQPKRKVTLEELLLALDSAIKVEAERKIEHERMVAPINIVIETEDIDEKKEKLMERITSIADKEGMTTFSILSSEFLDAEKILTNVFVPILFLAHENKIGIFQEDFFGEILIKITGEKIGRKGRAS
jgi:segregation and condensation protein A